MVMAEHKSNAALPSGHSANDSIKINMISCTKFMAQIQTDKVKPLRLSRVCVFHLRNYSEEF
jgi:hypothetical protein